MIVVKPVTTCPLRTTTMLIWP